MRFSGLYFILLLLICPETYGQTIQGQVFDSETKEPVPFTSVGSTKNNIASLSDEDGKFEYTISGLQKLDSLIFYSIGYQLIKISIKDIKDSSYHVTLTKSAKELEEIEVHAKKLYTRELGVKNFDKNNCSGFVDNSNNWKGSETAILISNPNNKLYFIKAFEFNIIKNELEDTLLFRVNFYGAGDYYPSYNILQRPIYLKTTNKNGMVSFDLSQYNIRVYNDFYVSLECLMDKVSINKFCFSGDYGTPSYVRQNNLNKWKRVKGGGASFKVIVDYTK